MSKVSSLILLCFLLISFSSFAQNSYLKVVLKAAPYDNLSDINDLDDSYFWDAWSSQGFSGFGLEYQRQLNNRISIKPELGIYSVRLTLFDYQPIRVVKAYRMDYINVGMIVNYHFKENHRGFSIGMGPSVFYMTKHRLVHYSINNRDEKGSSQIKDRFNTTPIRLQLEFSYSFNFLKLSKAMIDIEFGLTPAIKIKGFINDQSSSIFIPKGARLGVNILFRTQEESTKG